MSRTGRFVCFLFFSASLFARPITGEAAELYLYDDGLGSGWENWSYNSIIDLACVNPVYEGSRSLRVDVTGDWGALALNHSAVTVSAYQSLQFAAYGLTEDAEVKLFFLDGVTPFGNVALNTYVTGGTLGTGQWKTVSIPLADFAITGETITRLDFQAVTSAGRPAFVLDQLKLTDANAPPDLVGTQVSGRDRVLVYFSEAMNPASFGASAASLQNPDDPAYAVPVSGAFSAADYQSDSQALTIRFSSLLGTAGVYTLALSGFESLAGGTIPSNTTSTFSLVGASVDITVGENEHVISPYIYGVNLAPDENYLRGAGFTVNRRSGNDNSCYNWKIEASNKAEDGWYQNFRWDPVHSTNSMELTALMNARAGAAMFWTMPMQAWVAKDFSSYSFSVAEYGPQQFQYGDMGNGYVTNGEGRLRITGNNPRDAYVPAAASSSEGDAADTVYMDEWLMQLKSQFGELTEQLFPMVSLDNEIDIWFDVHHDTYPTNMTYAVMLDKITRYASMIRSNMPNLQIHGPVSTGWWFYWNSDAADHVADRAANGGYDFLEWLLLKLQEHENETGVRLIDALDIHYYPAKDLIFNAKSDAATRATRIAEIDSFWNTNFVDRCACISSNTWATTNQPANNKPYILPRFKELIANHYPGTKLCISEWQMGGDNDISAGVAVADGLGVFGREDLYMACYWRWGNDVPTNSPACQAFESYGNYDGEGGRFMPISCPTAASDPDLLSAYASRSRGGDRLTLALINKSPDKQVLASIDLSGFSPGATARVYRLSEPWTDRLIQADAITNVSASFEVVTPPYSVTLLVLDGSPADDDGDGMPTLWEFLYTNTTDASASSLQPYVADGEADNDHDGISNLLEYQALTDPTASASVFRLSYDAASFANLFSSQTTGERSYALLAATNLSSGTSWTNLGNVSGTGSTICWPDPIRDDLKYYRAHSITP